MSLIGKTANRLFNAVKAGGPAAQSGLQPNDIIIQVNGWKMSDYDHFSLRELLTTEPGRTIRLQFVRDRYERNVELTLEED